MTRGCLFDVGVDVFLKFKSPKCRGGYVVLSVQLELLNVAPDFDPPVGERLCWMGGLLNIEKVDCSTKSKAVEHSTLPATHPHSHHRYIEDMQRVLRHF